MRIARLDLLRYGKFTDQTLEFPLAAQDFHLVVGPNEAGKSTLRHAILDLLFEIETRSRFNFLHPHSDMRLGARIGHADSALDFVRTKARQRSLQTPAGSALPDNALAPYLGTVERSFFDQMFGLDHTRLVKGGQEILSASNDLGQILFQAAAGIGNLGAIREKLEQEADSLWGPRRSDKREYYLAAADLERAEAALKHTTVRAKDWLEARAAVDTLEAQLREARSVYDGLALQRAKLERVRRVAPLLFRVQQAEQQLTELGSVVTLPPDTAAQLTQAEQALAIGRQSLALFETQAAELQEKIAGAHPDAVVLARAKDIEALSAQRQQLRNHTVDIAKRETENLQIWQEIEEACRQLGWPATDEASALSQLPGSLVRASIDSLVRRHTPLAQALANAEEALQNRLDEHAGITGEMAALPATEIAVTLVDALSRARLLGDVAAQEKKLETQVRKLQRELATVQTELGTEPVSLEQLRAVVPATEEEIGALRKRRDDLEKNASHTATRVQEVQSEVSDLQLEITQYRASRQPVTRSDVELARRTRDTHWTAIKAGSVTLGDAAPGYEIAVQRADGLSDQRHDKAQAESELQARLDRLQRLQLQGAELVARATQWSEQLAEFDRAWQETSTAMRAGGLPLLQANSWRNAREKVLRTAHDLTEAQATQEEFGHTLDAARSALEGSLAVESAKPGHCQTAPPNLPLSALVLAADEQVQAATRCQARRSALAVQLQRAEAALPGLRHKLAQASQAWANWQQAFVQQLAAVHLPSDSSIATVETALLLMERMHQLGLKMRDTRVNRIDMMRRDLQDFAAAAQTLSGALAPEMADALAEDISRQLETRLKHHSALADERARWVLEREKALAQVNACKATVAEVQASLQPLLRLADVSTHEALRAATERSDRARTLLQAKDTALQQLIEAGDGKDHAALQAELAQSDLDAITAHLLETTLRTDEVVALQNRLSAELTAAHTSLARIAGQSEAARAESQRQEALARMGNALERYIKVYTAAKLLRWSIEKFRESRQGPMLERASSVFASLTQGRFAKLVVDYDSEPLRLSGQRSSGELVAIEGMSEGTRDQLYLALRLAALELHLAQTPALPFIADDLFINYDDGRAKAGLQALADLSQRTQVIFLTHHTHMIPLAQSVMGGALNVVHLA
ncbi:MAG: AAA family ATPase [Rhodoferax sp.]|nr:AAA family ATPase [Rhodoferax sp.]